MNSEFYFFSCRYDSNNYLKEEIAQRVPELKPSFSRPGFLTYKVESPFDVTILDRLIFCRLYGESLGAIELDENSKLTHPAALEKPVNHLHFWRRQLGQDDQHLIQFLGDSNSGMDPKIQLALNDFSATQDLKLNRRAHANDLALNVIEIDPEKYWLARTTVRLAHQGWPGGVPKFKVPETVVSRAYFKACEAMAWSRFPLQASEEVVELGAAPGGASQAILEKGLRVIGIDPAKMDPAILKQSNFRQIRRRGAEINKKDLEKTKWLFADANVAPKHTLDTIESIATNQNVHLSGMLITLKILQGKVIADFEGHLERIRSWGFRYVRARQLAFNRNEICVAALKRKSILRFGRKRKTKSVKPESSTDQSPA